MKTNLTILYSLISIILFLSWGCLKAESNPLRPKVLSKEQHLIAQFFAFVLGSDPLNNENSVFFYWPQRKEIPIYEVPEECWDAAFDGLKPEQIKNKKIRFDVEEQKITVITEDINGNGSPELLIGCLVKNGDHYNYDGGSGGISYRIFEKDTNGKYIDVGDCFGHPFILKEKKSALVFRHRFGVDDSVFYLYQLKNSKLVYLAAADVEYDIWNTEQPCTINMSIEPKKTSLTEMISNKAKEFDAPGPVPEETPIKNDIPVIKSDQNTSPLN